MEQNIEIIMTKQEAIKYYANKIIEDSLAECSEFNYCMTIEHYEDNGFIKQNQDLILEELKKDERIADVYIDVKTKTFDMVFWTTYCPWYYEEYDLKLEEQISILEKFIHQLDNIKGYCFILNIPIQKLVTDVLLNVESITKNEEDQAINMLKEFICNTDFFNKYLDKYKLLINKDNAMELQQELQEKLQQLQQQLFNYRKSITKTISKKNLDKMLNILDTDKNFPDELLGIFIYKDPKSNKYLGIDNRTGDVWIEEFEKEEHAIKFLYE